MCTRETQLSRSKKLVSDLLRECDQTVEKIKAHLHDDAIMQQDHAAVQEVFYSLIKELQQKNVVRLSSDSLIDTTIISLIAKQ